jgi:hypothetical protein
MRIAVYSISSDVSRTISSLYCRYSRSTLSQRNDTWSPSIPSVRATGSHQALRCYCNSIRVSESVEEIETQAWQPVPSACSLVPKDNASSLVQTGRPLHQPCYDRPVDQSKQPVASGDFDDRCIRHFAHLSLYFAYMLEES